MKTTNAETLRTITHAAVATIEEAARICRVGAGFPRGSVTYTGHAILWASDVTAGDARQLLRCLAVLGVSRGSWTAVETPTGGFRRAELSDLDGEVRGYVMINADGTATADLDYALTRPMQCMLA